MDLAGGGVDVEAGVREDARILSSGKVGGDSPIWGSYTTSRLQDLGYKTQDSTMQGIGDMSTCRI